MVGSTYYDPNANTFQEWTGTGWGDAVNPTQTAPGVFPESVTQPAPAPAPGMDAQTLAQYDQAINNTQASYDRQGSLLNSGYGTIDQSHQNALNQLLGGKNRATEGYNQGKLSTAQDYVGAKNTIGSQAGGLLNGLLRLLGSRGAGGGSAERVARGAVARGATLQRADTSKSFGQNNQSLDTGYNNYLQDYGNQVSSANSQRSNSRQTLENQINTNKASLLQTLAQLNAAKGNDAPTQGLLDQANNLLNSASSYQTAPIAYDTKAYAPPSLSSYTFNPQATPQFQGQNQTNDYTSPYLQSLLGKKQQAIA